MELLRPFAARLDDESGRIQPAHSRIERRLAQMRDAYLEPPESDALVHEVFNLEAPETNANILSCTTVLQPGKVGDEYHMTKGHWHEIRDRAEVYGRGQGQGRAGPRHRGRRARSPVDGAGHRPLHPRGLGTPQRQRGRRAARVLRGLDRGRGPRLRLDRAARVPGARRRKGRQPRGRPQPRYAAS